MDHLNHNKRIVLSSDLFTRQNHIHPRVQARQLDKFLGYKIPKIEVKLLQKYRAYDRSADESSRKQHYQGTQAWIGLHPQALQTPYCDIYSALSLLKDIQIQHVIDIGAGYGRVGIVLKTIYPEASFTGYEIVRQRQVEASRIYSKLELERSCIELQNVLDSDFTLPPADVYFIYDFSDKEDIDQILEILSVRTHHAKFYLIVRGERVNSLIRSRFNHVWKNHIQLESSDLRIYSN